MMCPHEDSCVPTDSESKRLVEVMEGVDVSVDGQEGAVGELSRSEGEVCSTRTCTEPRQTRRVGADEERGRTRACGVGDEARLVPVGQAERRRPCGRASAREIACRDGDPVAKRWAPACSDPGSDGTVETAAGIAENCCAVRQ